MTAEPQDLSRGTITKDTTQWLCCPSIINVAINAYPVCNNKDCSKKITLNIAGSWVIHCQSCNRAMLLKQCLFKHIFYCLPQKRLVFRYLSRYIVALIEQCHHTNKPSMHLTNLFNFKVKTERTSGSAHDKRLIRTDAKPQQ